MLLPSLEPSRGDGSNEGSQHMFILRNTPQPRYNHGRREPGNGTVLVKRTVLKRTSKKLTPSGE